MNTRYKEGLVSVIIPCFNASQYISEAISSVLNQTYSNYEIIVIDDGSTDNTKTAIEIHFHSIKYFYKDNGGPASARNLGIAKANGEYIAFLDADDYWLPDKLALQIDVLKTNSQYGLIHSNYLIREEGRDLYPRFLTHKPPSGNVFESLFIDNHIGNLTVVIRRECLEAIGRFDESRELISIEDYEFWLRIARSFEIRYIDKPVAVYRVHATNISNPATAIEKQLYLLHRFESFSKNLRTTSDQIVAQKRAVLLYGCACNLMEIKRYNEAKPLFAISARRKALKLHSCLGILSCLFHTNILFRSRNTSLNYKHYANYLSSRRDYLMARKYYRASISYYPLQKILFTFFR